MHAEDALNRFRSYESSEFDCFTGVSVESYANRMSRASTAEMRLWRLPQRTNLEFVECMGLFRDVLTTIPDASDTRYGPLAVMRAVVAYLGLTIVPWYALLDCVAAWTNVRAQCSNSVKDRLDHFLANHGESWQTGFVDRCRGAVGQHVRLRKERKFAEALELADNLEVTFEVAPSAFRSECRQLMRIEISRFARSQYKLARDVNRKISGEISELRHALCALSVQPSIACDLASEKFYDKLVDRNVVADRQVGEYHRLACAARAIMAFRTDSGDGSWPISDDKMVVEYFNHSGLANVVIMLERVDPAEMLLNVQDRVQILLATDLRHSAESTWRHLISRIVNPVYQGNQIHAKTLLHFFFGFLMSGIQRARVTDAMKLFIIRVADLDHEISKHVNCTPAFCKSLWRAIAVQIPDSSVFRFGHMYHYDRVVDSDSIYRLFADVAHELSTELGSDFARQHYTEFGFILPNDFRFPEIALKHLPASSPVVALPNQQIKSKHRESKIDPKWAEIADVEWSTSPFTFDRDYEILIGHSAWKKMLRRISIESDGILQDMVGKDGNDQTLTTTLWVRVKGIETHEIIRALIARNVVCWCALRPMKKANAAVLLGHVESRPRRPRRKRTEIDASKSSDQEKPKDTLSHFTDCLRRWGLEGLDEKQFAQGKNYRLWKEHEKAYALRRLKMN